MRTLFRVVELCVLATIMYVGRLHAQETTMPHVVFVFQVEPPKEWREIYTEVEKCMNKRGDFAGVEWFVTSAPMLGAFGGKVWGLWHVSRDGQRKILAYHGQSGIIRHEIIHDILYLNGFKSRRTPADSLTTDPEHPMPPFGKCGFRYYEEKQ